MLCCCAMYCWTGFIIVITLPILVASLSEAASVSVASFVLHRFQARVQSFISVNTEDNVVFTDVYPKRQRSAENISRI